MTEGKFRTVINWAIPPIRRYHCCFSFKKIFKWNTAF